MVIRIRPRAPHATLRVVVAGILVVGFAVVGCMPGGATSSPSPAGTSAVAATSGAVGLAPSTAATPRARPDSPFGGANPLGWTAALNDLGVGPYVLVSLPTYEEAMATAASDLRDTDRPVGLVMWRGRHAWVMSGFEATADPARFDEFEVTGVRVHDPLYPHGSTVWGGSPKPDSLLTPAQLAKQYVIRDRGRVNLGVPPGWLLILPVDTEA